MSLSDYAYLYRWYDTWAIKELPTTLSLPSSNAHHFLTAQAATFTAKTYFKQDSWAYYSILTFNFNTQTNC